MKKTNRAPRKKSEIKRIRQTTRATRKVRREGELAVRVALGASAGALRRMLLAESLLLCGAGQ